MELNTPRLTMPSRTLLDGAPYVPAIWQDTAGILARWTWERGPDNPSNYPEFGYETDAAGRFTGEQ